jgi:hypothetical protein
MDETGEHHVKQSKPGWEGQRLNVFPHIWKLDLKNVSKNTYMIHTHTYREHDCNSGTVWGAQGEVGKKKRMIESE